MSTFLKKKLDTTRGEIQTKLRELDTAVQTRGTEMTADEVATFAELVTAMSEVNTRASELMQFDADNAAAEAALRDAGVMPESANAVARDIGEFYEKSGLHERMQGVNWRQRNQNVSSESEFRLATDPTLTSNTGGLQTTYGEVIQTKYRRLTIADLLASGSLSTPTLTYWTQGALTGDVATVAEGALKPSLNFIFGQVSEVLSKLAGVTKVSTEMTEDAAFMVSIIRSQLQLRLGVVEEDQLLNGNGTAPNVRGLLNRSGIQTYATSATASVKKWLDGIFHAANMVRLGSFIEPDGIVMNPTDYEFLRLGADSQGQYFGGGPFTGAYGNQPGFANQPGLWNLPTVVTPAIAAGTALIGAFGTAAQLFRKGGVVLDSTNSNEDDFKKNLIALRIEERIGLACYFPTAFVKLTLTA